MAQTDRPTLLLYGVCGDDFGGDGYTARSVAQWLADHADASEVEVRISSGGGFIDDGLAIYNQLRGFVGKVTTVCDSIAGSIAALIFMAGEQREMQPGSMLFLHNPWNVTMGDADAHRKQADALDKAKEQHAGIIADRSGAEASKVAAWMDGETWFAREEALASGLATAAREDRGQSAVEAAMGSLRLDFLNIQSSIPARLARAQGFGAKRPVGMATPSVAAEVTVEHPMTAKDTSAASDTVETKIVVDEAAVERARSEAVKAERHRAAEIRRMASSVRLPDEFANELIDGGKTVDEANRAIIEAVATAQAKAQPATKPQSHVVIVADDREKWLAGAQSWLIAKAGLSALVQKHTGEKIDPGEFRGMRMDSIAAESLVRAGERVRGVDPREMVGMAFTIRGSMNTTSDFAVLLENTMHKVLQAAYAVTPDTWSRFCKTGTVSDFRAHNRYRVGSFGALDLVNEAGEFKNKSIPDGEKGTITAQTKGNIAGLSRQAIINDDMGVFNDIAVMLGRAAKLSIESDVYALFALNSGFGPTLADGKALFHDDHYNKAPTGGAPTVALFDAARVLMGSQMDPSRNEYLSLAPAVWVGPLSMGGTVRVLVNAQYDPDTANKLQMPNRVNGIVRDIVDTPRLSGTPWYFFADPNVSPVLEVAFLNGEQAPYVDSQDGWRVDGVEWKVRLDYGVAGIDFRGAVRNAGQ